MERRAREHAREDGHIERAVVGERGEERASRGAHHLPSLGESVQERKSKSRRSASKEDITE